MSHTQINAKVSAMSVAKLLKRREELYHKNSSNIEAKRQELYLELGLIEQRLTNDSALIRMYFVSPFEWVRPPPF